MFRLSDKLARLEDRISGRWGKKLDRFFDRRKGKWKFYIPLGLFCWYFYGMLINSVHLGIKSTFNATGDPVGSIEMPMAVGLVGGATKIHPTAKVAVKMLGVKTAGELAQIIAAVGLAQNMAAMRALATEGIQRGHMSLHARNLAATAGATGELLEKIVKQMVSEKNVRLEYAQELVKQYQK